MKSAPPKAAPASDQELAILLLVGAVALVAIGVAALVWLLRSRRRAADGTQQTSERLLGELLLASLAPEFREYLQTSNPAQAVDRSADDLQATIQRLAYISLRPPNSREPGVSLDEVAVGVAWLESRLAEVSRKVSHLDDVALRHDQVVWTVMGVLGAVLGLIAGLVGIVAGVAQLLGK